MGREVDGHVLACHTLLTPAVHRHHVEYCDHGCFCLTWMMNVARISYRLRCTSRPHLVFHSTAAASARDRRAVTATMALPRRVLGNTGLEVSVLGFGASPLGGVFQVRSSS
jgi:hypothetical protein